MRQSKFHRDIPNDTKMTFKDTTMDDKMTIRERFQENTIFEFLNELREGGTMNMFEAVPVIVERFDITKYEAHRVLVKWMESFGINDKDNGS